MNILVCIKQVPAKDAPLAIAGNWIKESDIGFEMNEPDSYALEEALRLKEKHGGEVIALSLGPERYLEIIAPDPQQSAARSPRLSQLVNLRQPLLVGWAVHTKDIEAIARRLRDAKIPADGPNAGSRVRPDGKILRWRTLVLEDDVKGLLPFFIEWGAGSVHPSVDAPAGCKLTSFEVESQDDTRLREMFQKMGIEVTVRRGAGLLRARIAGLHGDFELTS